MDSLPVGEFVDFLLKGLVAIVDEDDVLCSGGFGEECLFFG